MKSTVMKLAMTSMFVFNGIAVVSILKGEPVLACMSATSGLMSAVGTKVIER
jgi:hypothetical protein